MNFKCKCGTKYRAKTPEFTGDIEAVIYTDGVVEGAVTPRKIDVFICDTCKKIKSVSECEQIEEVGKTLLEPTTEEYLEILKDEKFKNLNIRIKTWQRSNDKYREIDSLDDLKVKVELLKATISQIPSITHFNQYIAKMVKKKEALSDENSIIIVEEKINELIQKREEVFGRLKEKNHLNNITSQIKEMEEIGEAEVVYTSQEKENMKILLDTLGGSSAEKILKAELYRNLGEFEKSTVVAGEITEKQYEKIKDLIKNLSERKLKKPARLNS
ncbi:MULTISPECIES: hypothetical protein [Psychrilyobacter]|uniref:Uncharacterized protein n=1 Tax=Psychrilyobacter piezotolerans TaxID=2293438 RepID=A0ABX9KEA6_9FUSO|nr:MULTISPECIES: hypothetical protein [Psychrilyobacter]MCS5421673.1 hypothetical protein [Psychrilyobacter sp. S5]NDI78823.1 hypothetical protein [Psychrilyobacter piezotolerans]RDE59529.1 hypothetical protein DV867_12820 [Psychrilyobacter sp. S5]REI39969.1 hypothetical protein DYH56_12820 [Psychrilyobacter piezotolerans]